MRREDVLKDLIHTGNIEILNLKRAILALTPPDTTNRVEGRKIGEVWRTMTEYKTLDRNSAVQTIQGVKYDQPLFRPTTPIMIDQTWGLGIDTPIQTTVGKLIFNVIAIRPAFGDKLGYINDDHVNLGKIDGEIARRLRDKPKEGETRDPNFIYTDELVAYQRYTRYLEQLAILVNISATPKTILPAPGIVEARKAILEKYKGKLHDPVEAVRYEKELEAYDDAFLKDDPGYGIFISGKIKGVARKRLFQTGGMQLSFDKGKAVVVEGSLSEKWSDDPATFVKMVNDARVGSQSRGADTVKGGVTAKQLLRPVTNYTILREADCRTKTGIRDRIRNETDAAALVGRYVALPNGNSVLVENIAAAKHYIGQNVVVRSPAYCVSKGQTFCGVCAGKRLSENSDSLSIAVTEISNIVLYALMKLMHGVEYSLTTVELDDVMT